MDVRRHNICTRDLLKTHHSMHILDDTAIELCTILPGSVIDVFIIVNSDNNNTLVDELNFEFQMTRIQVTG